MNNTEHQIDIDNIMLLSRLYLSDQEKKDMQSSLETILTHLDKLSSVDVEGVEPSAHVFPLYNVFREDVTAEPWPVETTLKNAPQERNNLIIVPKVVE